MELVSLAASLDPTWKLVVAYAIGAIVATCVLIFRRRFARRSHTRRIGAASRALQKLKTIGSQSSSDRISSKNRSLCVRGVTSNEHCA